MFVIFQILEEILVIHSFRSDIYLLHIEMMKDISRYLLRAIYMGGIKITIEEETEVKLSIPYSFLYMEALLIF